jgi:hypothetical protein
MSEGVKMAGMDSAFYLIEERLKAQGHERRPWEHLGKWFQRIEEETSGEFSSESLAVIKALHYRYRFDPEGISGEDRERLGILVQDWLSGQDPSGPMQS